MPVTGLAAFAATAFAAEPFLMSPPFWKYSFLPPAPPKSFLQD
jgi:hypothetical protein